MLMRDQRSVCVNEKGNRKAEKDYLDRLRIHSSVQKLRRYKQRQVSEQQVTRAVFSKNVTPTGRYLLSAVLCTREQKSTRLLR